jgi:hypothetical protein
MLRRELLTGAVANGALKLLPANVLPAVVLPKLKEENEGKDEED